MERFRAEGFLREAIRIANGVAGRRGMLRDEDGRCCALGCLLLAAGVEPCDIPVGHGDTSAIESDCVSDAIEAIEALGFYATDLTRWNDDHAVEHEAHVFALLKLAKESGVSV